MSPDRPSLEAERLAAVILAGSAADLDTRVAILDSLMGLSGCSAAARPGLSATLAVSLDAFVPWTGAAAAVPEVTFPPPVNPSALVSFFLDAALPAVVLVACLSGFLITESCTFLVALGDACLPTSLLPAPRALPKVLRAKAFTASFGLLLVSLGVVDWMGLLSWVSPLVVVGVVLLEQPLVSLQMLFDESLRSLLAELKPLLLLVRFETTPFSGLSLVLKNLSLSSIEFLPGRLAALPPPVVVVVVET